MSKPVQVAALEPVADAFTSLGINFYAGGSLASSVHGVFRSTVDVDLVADVKQQNVSALVARLQARYYIDDQMMRDAIRSQGSFNLIHLESAYKVDVFIMRQTAFEQSIRRRAQNALVPDSENLVLPIVAAEDIVLSKLDWFRHGGETSERQWLDVLGVLRVQQEKLDRAYLHTWAAQLNVTDLLERALREAEA